MRWRAVWATFAGSVLVAGYAAGRIGLALWRRMVWWPVRGLARGVAGRFRLPTK